MDLSPLLLVRQNFPDRSLRDPRQATLDALHASGFAQRFRPGSRIAIGAGSRGIAHIAGIVRAVVDYWKAAGMKPFVFPAMGSHGAATAEGQADVLAHYGIHEAALGCPVVSQLEVVSLGRTGDGIEALMDRAAYEADGVMFAARVKWHTDFAGGIESGLFKMMAIGLGKFAGARRYHTYAYRLGLERVIRTVGQQVLASGKVLGGLAILEDARHNTAQIVAVGPEEMERREEELLELVKGWMPKLPVPAVDILMLDEMGKNISGAGMDTKVINRGVYGGGNQWPGIPRVERVLVRDLSSLSYGNAVGVGLADVIHDRLLAKIDWAPTEVNSLTSSTPPAIRTPIHYPSDRMCLEKIWPTVGRFESRDVTIAWIRNTLELELIGLTENLRPEFEGVPGIEILGPARPWDFNEAGDLRGLPAAVPAAVNS